jgi:ATP-dependent Clp protease ATP-binding subunit ClpX
MADDAETPARVFHCSFCAKPQVDVLVLVSGPGVFICNECVKLCESIIVAHPTKPTEPAAIMTPERAPTDQLLKVLKGYNTAFERVDQSMQDVADILRERDVSWAAIGETLGVSRQAAWKRFG